jgi:hypothetical protein
MKGATAPKTAPTSLSAVASSTSVAISFTAPSDDGGSAITNYEYSFNNSSWTALSPADATSPITISGLSGFTSYSVYLRAVNIVGSGPASSAVSFTTFAAPTTTINAVNNVNQSRGTFNATISANGSSTAVYFQYNTTNSFAALSSEAAVATVTTQSAAVSYTQTGLSTSAGVDGGGVGYYVRVVAVNSAGTTYSGVTSFNTWGLRAYSTRTPGVHNMTVPTVSGLVPHPLPEVYIIGSGGGGGYTGSGGGAGGYVARTNVAFTAADGYMTIVVQNPGAGGYNLQDGNTGTFNGAPGGYCQLYGSQFSSLVAGGGGGGAYEGYGGNVGSGDNPAYTGGNYAVYIVGKSTYKAAGGGAGNDGNGGNGVATATGNVVSGNGGPGNGFWGNAGGGGGGDRHTQGANGSPYNVGAGGAGGDGVFANGSPGVVGQVYFTYYGP